MALFIQQFVDSSNDITPVVWEHEGVTHTYRAYVLCWCLDAPARAAVQNCIIFNGYMGCPYCLTRGEHLDECLRYVNLKDATPRTPAGVLRDMEIARQLGGTFPINGYFGPSPTVNLPHFRLVWGFTVEYMHAVLLGVAKQVTEMQLSSSNSQEWYYIGSTTAVTSISGHLEDIRPPHSFTRFPKSLSTQSHWKASEWRHWLLYYWLLCTLGILPEQYWLHLKKLVEAIHILLSGTLTAASVDRADFVTEASSVECALLAKASHYPRHSSVAAAFASDYDISPSIPGHRDIIHDVVREELKKLLPTAERPASISIAEVVRVAVLRSFLPDAPVTVAAPE
ncbi:hypothetical protein HPB47_018359 [Ixodes persulcatus]|uniref:Uncharacterized protein n=1 Tax=Ixodes persulcatus TaxID=34615 RepID=A0AC60QNH0_IXOPE|nr:hypothetical protein HPB47_018359 [Ixodes persulcatus]